MDIALHSRDATFAANRAVGEVVLRIEAGASRSRRKQVREQGSLRARFPNAEQLEAVLVNTAGGIAGGDRFAVALSLGEGAELLAGTAAAEKIYRSHGPASEVSLKLSLEPRARLSWLPQETILFDGAQLSRRIEVDLAEDSAMVLAEAIVFGRAAMGEAMRRGNLIDRWRVRRGGRLIFAESARLGGEIAQKLAHPAIAQGGIALATVLIAPGGEETLALVRALDDRFAGEVGISAWNGIAVARFCAREGAMLRHDLTFMLAALKTPLPRLWLK